MAFSKKTWKDRLVEYAGRRTLKRVSGSADNTIVVDVLRNEGTVSQAGDAFSAKNMNDLEQRIADGFDVLKGFQPVLDSSGKITGYKTSVGADTVFPFKGNGEKGKLLYSAKGTSGGTRNSNQLSLSYTLTQENIQNYSLFLVIVNTTGGRNWCYSSCTPVANMTIVAQSSFDINAFVAVDNNNVQGDTVGSITSIYLVPNPSAGMKISASIQGIYNFMVYGI